MVARLAACSGEAVLEDAASQVTAQLFTDVFRERCVVRLAGMLDEGLEVRANDTVKDRVLGTTRTVRWRELGHARAFAASVPIENTEKDAIRPWPDQIGARSGANSTRVREFV